MPTAAARVKRLTASVILYVCVCLYVRTTTQKRMTSNLVYGNDLEISYKWYDFEIKRSKVAGSKVQGERVTGVSYALYRVPSL